MKQQLKLTINLILLLLCVAVQGENLSAQPPARRVTGVVKNSDQEILPGVTVQAKGTTKGTITNAEGAFELLVSESDVLVFSFLGCVSQAIPVSGRSTINVTLLESATDIDEVVVVAYGKQKKVSVTAAISTVETKELKQSSSANLAASLAGRLPGLTTMQTSGQPGNDKVNLYLRGIGTLNDASPLILIDGIPRSNISSLDPNEIATVSILKDASATAVFGVRGANGVIMITTRRGKAGSKPELSISADYGLQSFLVEADRIHSWDYAALTNQAFLNSNPGAPDGELPFTQYMINKYKSGEDPVFYPDRDLVSENFLKWAPQTRINANFNGGSDDFSYFLNVGYVGQGGNFRTDSKEKLGYDPSFSMDRYNFRGNIDYKIASNLTAALNISSNLEKMNSPQTMVLFYGDMTTLVSEMYGMAWQTAPTQPGPVTEAGYGVPVGESVDEYTQRSIYTDINRRGYAQNTTSVLNSSLSLNWGLDFITKGLSAKGLVAFDSHASTNLQASKTDGVSVYQAHVARDASETSSYSLIKSNLDASIALNKTMGTDYYMNYQASLEYAREFDEHHVSAMALFQRDNWDAGAAIPSNMLGFVGRATYNYDDRYLAEFNVGYNGSEQFAPANRFGTFPAASVGWVASNESFLKDNDVVTNLKLRGSYGLTGNDKLGGSRFLYQSVITMEGGIYGNLGKGQLITQGLMGNENIQWEVAEKMNLGIDLQVLKCLSLTVDLYNEHRDKILIGRSTIPILQGVPIANIPKVNLGIVDNKGLEAELTYQKIINRDFSVTVKGNFAYNENVVKYADEVPLGTDYANRYRSTGYSIGQKFGYQIDYSNGNGYINTQEELEALPKYDVGGGVPRLGDFKYVDITGDGVINDRDMVPIGYPDVPRISYAFSGTLNYKNFDLSFLFTGIAQSSYYLNGLGVTEFTNNRGNGFFSGWHLKAWTPERYANGEEILYPALGTSAGVSQQRNDVFIMNRSFLRLKNLEIGYRLPERLVKTVSLSSVRVYVNGNNLWTWKAYMVNTVDPEQEGSMVYGLTRMVNFGVNVVF
jgi:TonB-linked SusC/RagA family outer membrane protein